MEDQLDSARLAAALRQLGLPLSEIREILGLEPKEAADRMERCWAATEPEHTSRRQLAAHLVERMRGRMSIMYEVGTQEMPDEPC